MIKYFLLLFNVLGLLFYKSFFETEPVTVSHNFPESVSIGLEYVVEVKINKSDVSGFAEFRQLLPPGFDATVLDCKKGSFSFSDHEVKIIWMTIPDEQEFTIQYKITVLSDAAGDSKVDGSFSYLDNNQKTTVNLEQKQIKVNTTANASEQNSIDASLSKTTTTETISEMNLPVVCSRLVNSSYEPGKILVEVAVQNDSVSGFAKLEELIPAGFKASPVQVQNAVFSFVDQKVKFLWMSFPFEKEFTVSYLLTADETAVDSTCITGFLSFTLAEVSKKFTLGISPISLTANKLSAGGSTVSASNTNPAKDSLPTKVVAATETANAQISAKEEPVQTEKAPQTFVEAAKKIEEESKSGSPLGKANEVNNTASNQTGISFRVQICATRKPVELNYFKTNYQLNEEIYAEMHEGWHKFTLNTVPSYKEARNKREELKQNQTINGPFVTAYNAGSRITVQEALMIANQKWVR